jgi:hypothetical protein
MQNNKETEMQFASLIHEIRTANEHSTKIAVLDVELRGQREQQKEHAKEFRDGFVVVGKRLDSIETKVDALTATMNRGRGAFAASLAISGTIGAGALALIQYLTTKQ